MPFARAWCKIWIYIGFVFAWTKGARPRFDTSTDMGLVLIPADAEVDSVIFRLRATDQDADFPLVFEVTATITPVVRIDNLPCTLYNNVCQANVILTKQLVPGRLHDFAVRVRDTKGDSSSMQATISVTNATTPRDKIFPHIPALIKVPEDTKPGKELDYLLVRANQWSGKPVYIELWQPKQLFTIRQRHTPTQTRGIITLIGELDFETQSVYSLTMYATDPYTEPGKDTRNIAGLNVFVVITDVQDVPPIFTLAPPLTRINNSMQPGDVVLRVHAEDGDKGVPRDIVYGLVSEGNPFTPFFNISETTGEIILARPLEELTQITHVGAPVVLTVVAEELRKSREEPPAQATVVDVGFLLGEPGNSPPYFESDNYIAKIDENLEAGTVINFGEYSTKVKDEDIGKAGVFALKLENNNRTFEINPTVAERNADFVIIVRDNTLIDYELYKTLSFKIVAQEVGPATNLSASVPVTIFLQDVNDNPPVFDEKSYEVTLSENITAGSRVIQVHATDIDTGSYGEIRYTDITGEGSEAFTIDPDTGLITVAMGSSLDRETAAKLLLSVEARDENGSGNKGDVPLTVNLLDVNDNAPVFENGVYEFTLNPELTNFTAPAFIKALDADAEPPNNIVKYELIHGNYENKFYLNETSGELILRSPITRIRRKKQSAYNKFPKERKEFVKDQGRIQDVSKIDEASLTSLNKTNQTNITQKIQRWRRANDDALYTLTARAYDLGIPHLSSVTEIRIVSGIAMEARIMMFVVPGEQVNSTKTAETLATITGGRVTVLETRPYVQQNQTGNSSTLPAGGNRSIIVARVEQTEPGTPLVDVEKIRDTLAANGVRVVDGGETTTMSASETKAPVTGIPYSNGGQTTIINNTITKVQSEEVTVYKAENKLLLWLLIILGLLMLLAIAALIICCICPGCPFYMAPRKRRVHSSETLVARADGRPKRHLHRQPAMPIEASWNGRKQAWSADPTRRNWQFNKRNVKNCSLPGDVAYISGQPNDIHLNAEVPRMRDTSYDHSRRSRMDEQERMYMEEIDGQKTRGYDPVELDSLQRHEMERGSGVQRQGYRQRYMDPDMNESTTIREQHFYREGNAEVLRLVTRGQVEDTTSHPYHHHPTTLIVDGKDIILQRFIQDQKSRHEMSMQDIEAARVMDPHQRPKETCQQPPEIILIPDRLDLGTRQHVEEIGPNVQRLVIDHGDYETQKMEKDSQIRETLRPERQMDGVAVGISERPTVIIKDHAEASKAQFSFSDLEPARQKTLLARLLLRREHRHAEGGIADSASYLETQSLPGQVAIATQTDRTTATQTERQVRSRSDNDESDEDSRYRKKLRSRKKHGEGDWRRVRTLWMKSPIEEEASPRFDKRLNILRKKVREVKEDRKVSLEPEVLREISDSLDGNGSSYKGEEDESVQTYRKSTEQTSISYKILSEKENGSPCSMKIRKGKSEKDFGEKNCEDTSDYQKVNGTESTSSPEIKVKREKQGREKMSEKSPKKEAKSKIQKKPDGIIKPSFRILEKEFTMFTKKLSKLGDKKFQDSTCSDSTSQEKLESKDPKKDMDHRPSKKPDASSSQKQMSESTSSASKTEQKGKQKKDAAIAKTKQKLKYQQTHVMSTGSSEYDDMFDKTKKQSAARQEISKQKHSVSQSHGKLKRQTQVDRREGKKQRSEFREEEMERKRDSLVKEIPKSESKSEKTGKVTRAPKLATIARKDHVMEETTTSTNSDQPEGKKDAFALFVFEKKSSDSSGKNVKHHRDKQPAGTEVMQRFSDDFVVESKVDSAGEGITYDKGKQDNVKKKQIATEKQLSVNDKVQLRENEGKTVKTSVEQFLKTEIEAQQDDKSTTKIAEDSMTPQNITQQLVTSSVGFLTDTAGFKEEKEIEASEPETITIEKPTRFREESKKLINIQSAIKFSSRDEAKTEKQKDEMIKDKKEIIQVEEKKSKDSTDRSKSVENARIQTHEIRETAKDHTQTSEALRKMHKQETFSVDDEKEVTSMETSQQEINQEMSHMLKKQEDQNLLQSDTKRDIEVKDTTETESSVKRKIEEEKLEVKSAEMQSNVMTNKTQDIGQSDKENAKDEFLRDQKSSTNEYMLPESKEHEKEKLLEKKEHSESIKDQITQKAKEETIKNIEENREKQNIDIDAVQDPSQKEEIISETDNRQIEENSSLKKDEKFDDRGKKSVMKCEIEKDKDKIEENVEKVASSKEEVALQEIKNCTEIKQEGSTFLGKEETFPEEKKAVEDIIAQGKEDNFPDKEKVIIAIVPIDSNIINTQDNILLGPDKLLDKKEVELDNQEISEIEKPTILSNEDKEKTEKEEIKKEEVDAKRHTIDSQEFKEKESVSTETLKAEDYHHPIDEKKGDDLKTEPDDSLHHEIILKMPNVNKDDIIQEQHGSSTTDSTIEQNIQKDEYHTEVPTSPEHKIEKASASVQEKIDNQVAKEGTVLADMFKAVHLLAQKSININSSTSTETEPETTTLSSHSESKVIDKEVPSLSLEKEDKDLKEISKISESSDFHVDDKHVKEVEKVDVEDTKNMSEDKVVPKNGEMIKMPETDLKIDTTTEPEEEKMKAKATEGKITDRSTTPADGNIAIEWKEMIEKDLKIAIMVQPEERKAGMQIVGKEVQQNLPSLPTEKDMAISPKEVAKEKSNNIEPKTEEIHELSKELPKDLEKESQISTQKLDKAKDFQDTGSSVDKLESSKVPEKQHDALHAKAEELVEKVLEESVKLKELHIKAEDDKLEQSEKEFHGPLSEVSDSSQGTESLQTSMASRTTKEKFPSSSMASETPADSQKILEPEEHIESKDQQAELQTTEQSAEKRTPSTRGDEAKSFLKQQSLQERESSIVPPDESSKQDSVKKETDETSTLEGTAKGEEQAAFSEEYPDVSLPLFTSIIRTVDDSDDSDSSSDISRKTTLTTRPYHTPRHRSRQSPERDYVETMEGIDTPSVEDEEERLTVELEENKDTESLRDDQLSKDVEDLKESAKEKLTEIVSTETEDKGKDTESKEPGKTSQREEALPQSADGVPEAKQLVSKFRSKSDKESSKDDAPAAPKRKEAGSLKPHERQTKEMDKKRVLAYRKKKSTSEESSEEKATHSHSHARYRFRKKPVEDSKQKQEIKQTKKPEEQPRRKQSLTRVKSEKDKKGCSSSEKQISPKTGEIDTSKAQPKYMAWYKKNREEMEKRRAELRATDDEDQLPRWLRRSMKNQKSEKDEKKSDEQAADTTPKTKRKIKPLVNVESEQLKAIVRQGRKLRRAEGGKNEDPPIQIFASTPPAQSQTDTKHHLVQHSEYKYERIPAPFYLHPPPAPHPSPQMSPERFDVPPAMQHVQDEDFDSGIAISLQGGNRLRHQQLLEKKSVFDIAYSEAAPPQLRADSTTPPS